MAGEGPPPTTCGAGLNKVVDGGPSPAMTRGCIARVSGSGAWYNVVPLPLPAFAPERNPTENLWQYLRSNYLSHEVYENYEAVVNAGRDA